MKPAQLAAALVVGTIFGISGLAQTPAAPRAPQPAPVISPEVSADRKVTFRILAPAAEAVKLNGGDIPGSGQGRPMTKGENGVWEVTVGPLEPGAYRYTFNVNGLAVVDPRNPAHSESNNNVWSMVAVAGSDFMDASNVPHGAVAALTYYSTSLQRNRRMTIYTPPGYEAGKDKYPVFYLLHGSSDSDASWSTVGRAGFIADNLISSKKAKPMIIVMPAGHTATAAFRGGGVDEFLADFNQDIMPYVEKHYRTIADRNHRAIAGLSMGGSQTLNIAIPHLNQFAYVGVYSSGLIGSFGPPRPIAPGAPPPPPRNGATWEKDHLAQLDDAAAKKGLKLFWFATGKDDGLITTTQKTVELLKTHGFNPVMKESAGGHTWLNWRDYLNEFTPQLFQ